MLVSGITREFASFLFVSYLLLQKNIEQNKTKNTACTYSNWHGQHSALLNVVQETSFWIVTLKNVPPSHITQHSPCGPFQWFNMNKIGNARIDNSSFAFNFGCIRIALASHLVDWWKILKLREGKIVFGQNTRSGQQTGNVPTRRTNAKRLELGG